MFPTNGLYSHIQKNALKSALLLAGFVMLVAVFWYAWCVIYSALWWTPVDLPRRAPLELKVYAILWHALDLALWRWWVPLAGAMCWFCIAYAFHSYMIRVATGAEPVTRKQAPKLYNMVETLAISAGLPMPRIEMIETDALNAYAAGIGPADAVVAVTTGLMEALDADELEAVLAHEMTHIKNHDVRLMVVATVFAGGLTMVGDVVGRAISGGMHPSSGWSLANIGSRSRSSENPNMFAARMIALLIGVAMLALTHLFALLIRFAMSRSREFMADAGAVELTKNPDALISALQKISANDEIPGLPDRVQAMMISARFSGLFATHPPIEARIGALQAHAGGRVTAARRVPSGKLPKPASGPWGGVSQPAGAMGFGRRQPKLAR
jgi:heat shock protein HtpX